MKETKIRMVKVSVVLFIPLLLFAPLTLVFVGLGFADVPAPVLAISQTGSNTFQIRITNAVGSANYELYRRELLTDPAYPWTLPITGALGQAVFNVTNINSTKQYEFFRASVGSDWDGDGVPNWQDSQPSSTNGGLLSITIDSPAANGNVP